MLEIGVKSVGVVLAAALGAWFFKGGSAAQRHRIWALGFVGLAVLPFLSVRMPAMRVQAPAVPAIWNTIDTPSKPISGATQRVSPPVQVRPVRVFPTYGSPSPKATPDWRVVLATVWMLGAAAGLVRLGGQLVTVLSCIRNGKLVDCDLGVALPRFTRVLQSSRVRVPVTFGWAVLLPTEFWQWPPERVRAVVLHEVAHIRRGDWAWLVFGQVVGAFYWPNLAVFLAASRMRSEAEAAADDAVLSAGVDGPGYAATLVDFADQLRGRPVMAGLAFVDTGSLKARIASILRSSARRTPLGRTAALGMLLATIAVAIPVASAHLVRERRVGEGVLRLTDGSTVEIIAITEMRGGEATSWDMSGALLRRRFPVNEADWNSMPSAKPVPLGSTVRYAIVRFSKGDGSDLSFATAAGEALVQDVYPDPNLTGGNFRDAIGGQYRVLRLVLPRGARRASLIAKSRVGSGSKPGKAYAIQGIPLESDPEAVYVPHHFLPRIDLEAKDDGVELPEGGSARIDHLACDSQNQIRRWSPHGVPQGVRFGSGLDMPDFLYHDHSGRKRVTQVQFAFKGACEVEGPDLYDGEGWPLFLSPLGSGPGSAGAALDISVKRSDLVGCFTVFARHGIGRFSRSSSHTTWTYSSRQGWVGVLRVTYPAYLGQVKLSTIWPLDSDGKPIHSGGYCGPAATGPGWAEFDFTPQTASRVKSLQFFGGSSAWVRFPDVALQPPMVSVRK